MDTEPFFNDSLHLLGDAKFAEEDSISYGALKIEIAPKEGKACSLLADQLFSPSLALSELIELGRLPCKGKTWIELGAGTGLVSLVAAISKNAPQLLVLTDYPDQTILGALQRNVEHNKSSFNIDSQIVVEGYEWGTPVDHLRSLSAWFDVMIMSDLLYFDKSCDALLKSIDLLLARNETARVYVGAGKYTPTEVCQTFLHGGEKLGLVWTESTTDGKWEGITKEGTYSAEALQVRKNNSLVWIGRWSSLTLV